MSLAKGADLLSTEFTLSNWFRRLVGISGALLLQGILFAFLLSSTQGFRTITGLIRESTLIVPSLRNLPIILPRPTLARSPSRPHARFSGDKFNPDKTVPLALSPSSRILTIPQSTNLGIGELLNICAPENIGSLSEEQRSRCSKFWPHPVIQHDFDLLGRPSDVKDEARWADALARKQSPPWLPCSTAIPVSRPSGQGAGSGSVPGLDFACMAKAFADGSLTDPRSWPTYEVKQLRREDFYKIEQTYNEWHATHAKAP